MSLHVETQGSGAPLLLIHGWGMHGGMWGQVAEQLAQTHTVHRVDLPGHGQSKFPSPVYGTSPEGAGRTKGAVPNEMRDGISAHRGWSAAEGEGSDQDALSRKREREQNLLDEIVAQLSKQFTEPLTVVGWSLGGQIALRWAQLHPGQVQKLVLVATTPCFVQQENWSCAMAADTLQEFAASLLQNHALTLKRFLALQLRGSENERELLLDLRARLFANGEPDVKALHGGLEILRDTDMRQQLSSITQPTLVIAGERDTLTPQAASEALAQALPNASMEVIAGAAHAPFLSHSDTFLTAVRNFLERKNN